MKLIKYLLIPILLLFLYSCKKTEIEKIENIEFTYSSGLRIPYNEVSINIEKNVDSSFVVVHSKPLNNDAEWRYSKIDTVIFINSTTFEKLAKSLNSLDKIDINKAHKEGLDGYSCSIEYGAKGKNKSYSFWSPTNDTKKRGLTEFLNLCEQLLDISGLNKKKIME